MCKVMFRFFKKFFILSILFVCTHAYSINPRGSLHLLTTPPATMKNLNSFYMSSIYYSFSLSSYLPETTQRLTSKWSVGIESSWIHHISFDGISKAFPSTRPLFLSLGIQWEIDYLSIPITPIIGVGYAVKNIFKSTSLDSAVSEIDGKYYYLLRAGLFFSFDILNRYTSKKMLHEYNIQDIGLYAEYRMYISTADKYKSENAWSFGVITFF